MKMLKIIFWIILILAIVETGLETRASRRGYKTILFGSPQRGITDFDPDAPPFGPTSDFPFRSRIVGQRPTPGVDRLWLASASYGEDIYVEPDRIFPHLVTQILDMAGRPTEFLNASRAGDSIAGNIRFLNREAAKWSPRAVILYQMSLDANLLAGRLLGGRDTGAPGVPGEAAETGSRKKSEPNILVRYYESTTIYKTLKELVTGRATQQRILAGSLGPEAAPIFKQNILDFVSASRNLGIEPILCTFATSHDAGNYRQMSIASRNALFRYNIYLSLDGWVATISELNGVIQEVATAESLQLIDVNAKVGGHPDYFRDFIHFNRKGHAAVAEVLAAALLDGSAADRQVAE